MHLPARNQTSLGSAPLKNLLPGRLPGSVGISRGTGRGGFLSLCGCEAHGLELYRLLQTHKVVLATQITVIITHSAEALMGPFLLSPAIQASKEWGCRDGAGWYEGDFGMRNRKMQKPAWMRKAVISSVLNWTQQTQADQKHRDVANVAFQRPQSQQLPSLP